MASERLRHTYTYTYTRIHIYTQTLASFPGFKCALILRLIRK